MPPFALFPCILYNDQKYKKTTLFNMIAIQTTAQMAADKDVVVLEDVCYVVGYLRVMS